MRSRRTKAHEIRVAIARAIFRFLDLPPDGGLERSIIRSRIPLKFLTWNDL